MNEIINFSWEVIKLSIVVSLAAMCLFICTVIIYEIIRIIIIKLFNKGKLETPIKDRFDEAVNYYRINFEKRIEKRSKIYRDKIYKLKKEIKELKKQR